MLITFTIGTNTGRVPPPLTQVSMSLPSGVELGTSTLGLAVCRPETLEVDGPEGCPRDAIMGHGSAIAKVPFGPITVREKAEITIVMGPSVDQHTTLLFYAAGNTPVSAQLVFPGQILADTGPFGGQLITTIPRTPTVPDGANVSVVSVSTAIGPAGLLYYRRRNRQSVAYHPEGILLP